MTALTSIVVYWGLAFFLVVLFHLIGLSLTRIVVGRLTEAASFYSTGLGLSYLVCVGLASALYLNKINAVVLVAAFATPILVAVVLYAKDDRAPFTRTRFRVIHIALTRLMLATAFGTVIYVPLLTRIMENHGYITSASRYNADIGMYLNMAKNLISHGFSDGQAVLGIDHGALSRFDHPGAQASLAIKSVLLGIEPYQASIVAMSVVVAVLVLPIVGLSMRLNEKHFRWLIPAWAIFNPLVVWVAGDYFYSQLLTMALMMTLYLVLSDLIDDRFVTLPLIIFLGVASFMSSPEVCVMLGAVFVIPAILLYRAKRKQFSLPSMRTLVTTAGVVVTVLVLLQVIIREEISVLRRTTVAGISGWNADVLSPLGLLGMSPNTFWVDLPSGEVLLGLGLVVVAVLALIREAFLNRGQNQATSWGLLAAAVLIGTAVVVRYGTNGYQSWKSLVTLFPFTILGLALGIDSLGGRSRRWLQTVGTLAVGAGLTSTSLVWGPIDGNNFLNRDVLEVSRQLNEQRHTLIDIDLDPKLETMMVASLFDFPVNLVSGSYFSESGFPRKSTCVLTWRGKVEELQLEESEIASSGNYVVVGSSPCGKTP